MDTLQFITSDLKVHFGPGYLSMVQCALYKTERSFLNFQKYSLTFIDVNTKVLILIARANLNKCKNMSLFTVMCTMNSWSACCLAHLSIFLSNVYCSSVYSNVKSVLVCRSNMFIKCLFGNEVFMHT